MCTPRLPLCLSIKCVGKRLDRVIPILFVLDAVQMEVGDNRAVEMFGLSIRLWVVGLPGAFLYPEEHAKPRKEFAYKLGPIVGNPVVC